MESLQTIIQKLVIPLVPELLNLKVSPDHSLSFGRYLEIIERDIQKITQTTSRVTNTINGVLGKELYLVDIFQFLSKYCEEKRGANNLSYKLKFEFDDEILNDENGNKLKILIMANNDLLADLFDNLISNAEQHAFPGHINNRIEINLMLTMDLEKDFFDKVFIVVSNTGNAFPEDFKLKDFIRKGSTSGDKGGEGFGGWYINEIIKYFKGELNIQEVYEQTWLSKIDLVTNFEIIIPINQIEEDEKI